MAYTTNLKGEQGGIFKTAGETFDAATEAPKEDYAVGFQCLSETVLTSITMVGWGGTESILVGLSLVAGSYIPGKVSDLEVSTGDVQLVFH